MTGPRAVFVDVGGVLLVPNAERVAAELAPFAPMVDAPTADRAHYGGIAAMGHAPDTDRTAWPSYFDAYAHLCGVPDLRVREAAARLLEEFTTPPNIWDRIVPGAVAALRALTSTSRHVVIVSNTERGDVSDRLAELGVCQVGPGPLTPVAAIVDSARIGFAKPDARIFLHALALLDLEPDDAVHVGDTPGTDVAGALAAGIEPVLLDPHDDHPGLAHRRVRSLAEMPDLVMELLR
jgi:putative hydrolase of the HAD superfamily